MISDPHVIELCKRLLDQWEGDDIPYENRKGYNIGALIVSPENKVVAFERNAVNVNANVTEHAELNVIRNYLRKSGRYDLEDHIIYTSLEPCIMCVGAMIMSNVKQVYYCQHDYNFANAAERLRIDSRAIKGYPPYPRTVSIAPANSDIVKKLDEAHAAYLQKTGDDIMARFLASEGARMVYEDFVRYLKL
ncbi:MAG TPA: nucleoside deaminase [Chitinophagales bacterium]|nr:nucleoside deaminase [Saprospiraceae bacterium]HMU70745.1 nucleoside deaminase [Chitinophagales bacterium]HNJ90431.1 nucleoside deaminase [Chitinophagales bacterium]HNO29776.1 nucleoside deaminase [Chitinophagales bacterium]